VLAAESTRYGRYPRVKINDTPVAPKQQPVPFLQLPRAGSEGAPGLGSWRKNLLPNVNIWVYTFRSVTSLVTSPRTPVAVQSDAKTESGGVGQRRTQKRHR